MTRYLRWITALALLHFSLATGHAMSPEVLPIEDVSASDTQAPHAANHSIDGDFNTRWSALGQGQSIIYDLGPRPAVVMQVSIAWFQGDMRQAFFTIAVSRDGTVWTQVFRGQSSGATAALEDYSLAPALARYVRIIGFGNSHDNSIDIVEVEIQGRPAPPNIVFLLADDLGYGDLSSYGRRDLRTPNIDRLGEEGVRFTRHYANGPTCTPTRAALLTGRYPQRIGGLEEAIGIGNVGRYDDAIRLAETHDLGLPAEETSIAQMLVQAGYITAITGKWHLGYEPKFSPNRHRFDMAFYSIGGGNDYFHYVEPPSSGLYALYFNEEPTEASGYLTDVIADRAVAFIRQAAARPFFLYVPFTAPHSPYQGPDDGSPDPLPDNSPLWSNGSVETYIAMIESLDDNVGRILEALSDAGLAEDTLVIFASDNGATTRIGDNGDLRGGKGSTFEGGIRVPAFARWPGKIPAGTVSDQVSITMDFTASILAAAGVEPSRELDGMDILQHVIEARPSMPRRLFWRRHRGSVIRQAALDGGMKYVRRQDGDEVREWLYDLEADPTESRDLRRSRSDEFNRLRELYFAWDRDIRRGRRGAP